MKVVVYSLTVLIGLLSATLVFANDIVYNDRLQSLSRPEYGIENISPFEAGFLIFGFILFIISLILQRVALKKL